MILHKTSGALVACLFLCAAFSATGQAATTSKKSSSIPVAKPQQPAATTNAAPKKAAAAVSILPGSGSKEPIKINSDKLDFLSKENKLIYIGNVVAVQGDSTLKASKLNIDLQKDAPGGSAAPATPAATDAAAPEAANSSVRHMEADGPVTLISKDQVGTGDHASYDKGENKVYLKGHVTLSQGATVIQGDQLIYDLPSGQAQVEGNVTSVIEQRSGGPGAISKTNQ